MWWSKVHIKGWSAKWHWGSWRPSHSWGWGPPHARRGWASHSRGSSHAMRWRSRSTTKPWWRRTSLEWRRTRGHLGPLGKPLPLPGLKGYLFTLNSSNGGGSFLSLVGIDSSLFGPFCESTSILMPRSLVFNRQWTNSPM
ncbi:hypothetical protein NP493_157g01027 [Ridgeia piscesae]|uniref:Uncharacterized protein n=1 Tax=Ridgeia piscesae TaxID=27915 RepID=A0AAD9P3W7_RIDPI|nr:hypothetical protein NP493_157g01027 [Ridgeia piscesae]